VKDNAVLRVVTKIIVPVILVFSLYVQFHGDYGPGGGFQGGVILAASIILLRGKDGVVRGFHNVCSHRGNTVVTETGNETFGSSKAAILSCRFHGWVYDANGSLIQVPEEERFYSCFKKAENGLTSVRTEVWEGFVFVNLDAEGSQSLIDYLGAYGEHMGGFPYSELSECYSYWTNLECN